MKKTRRDILKFAGGTMVGALFTPAPWRLITDTALWSENWPGIPRPVRGERRAKFTHCTLCPPGCAVRANCIGEQPVALVGVAGGLCPFGVAAHHLPYHPQRLRQGAAKEAAQAVAQAIANRRADERVAVLDLRPGRTSSWTYRRAMASLPNGLYTAPPQPLVAVNLENAQTVLSLGAPLMDGWIAPAKAFAARDRFRLIQAEPVESRTAAVADVWLPIRPGSEEALALVLAGAIAPGEAAERTGLRQEVIADVARQLKENGPPLVVDRTMSPNVVALNVALGAWGRTVVPRAEAPVPAEWKKAAPVTAWNEVPERSVRVLLIDESMPGECLPWEEIQPKLVPDNPVVVAFGWSREGLGRHAQYCLPAAVYPEASGDVPAGMDAAAPALRIAASLVPPPSGMTDPVEFVAAAAGLVISAPLRQRADAIHAAGRGSVTTYADGKISPVKEVKGEEFWKALNAGGCWVGEMDKPGPAPKVAVKATQAGMAAPIVVVSSEPGIPASPLMSKVYQESNLRLGAASVALNPSDARVLGVADGARATLETPSGRRRVEVTVDPGVRPGVVLSGAREISGAPVKVVRI